MVTNTVILFKEFTACTLVPSEFMCPVKRGCIISECNVSRRHNSGRAGCLCSSNSGAAASCGPWYCNAYNRPRTKCGYATPRHATPRHAEHWQVRALHVHRVAICVGSRHWIKSLEQCVVNIANRLRAGLSGLRILKGSGILSLFWEPPYEFWGPPDLLFSGYRVSFLVLREVGHSHLCSSKVGMTGTLPLLPSVCLRVMDRD